MSPASLKSTVPPLSAFARKCAKPCNPDRHQCLRLSWWRRFQLPARLPLTKDVKSSGANCGIRRLPQETATERSLKSLTLLKQSNLRRRVQATGPALFVLSKPALGMWPQFRIAVDPAFAMPLAAAPRYSAPLHSREVSEAKLLFDRIKGLAIHFYVRVDKIIHWRPILLWSKSQIPAGRKEHPVRIQASEEEVMLGRGLPRFRDIHRRPT